MNLEFNIEDLTLGEIEDIEEYGGINIMAGIPDVPPVRFVRAWAWIIARRANPEMTFEDARNIRIVDLNAEATASPNADGGLAALANS